jgi:hypothetical protein
LKNMVKIAKLKRKDWQTQAYVRDDVIVEMCCKVGSEFVCPTKVPLFFKLCVTELSSVVVDNICDIFFFLFSFNVLYLFSELGFVCPVICIACSSVHFYPWVFDTDAFVRLKNEFWTYLTAHFHDDIVSYEYSKFKFLGYIPRHVLWLDNKWGHIQCKHKLHVIVFTKARQTKLKVKLTFTSSIDIQILLIWPSYVLYCFSSL